MKKVLGVREGERTPEKQVRESVNLREEGIEGSGEMIDLE